MRTATQLFFCGVCALCIAMGCTDEDAALDTSDLQVEQSVPWTVNAGDQYEWVQPGAGPCTTVNVLSVGPGRLIRVKIAYARFEGGPPVVEREEEIHISRLPTVIDGPQERPEHPERPITWTKEEGTEDMILETWEIGKHSFPVRTWVVDGRIERMEFLAQESYAADGSTAVLVNPIYVLKN